MTASTPPNARDVAAVVEKRLSALTSADGTIETTVVEWRGEPKAVPVITMPVNVLSYNPDTHRIRVQRTLDPVRDQALDDSPYSPGSQAYLHELLMGTPSDPTKTDPAFILLKEDLRENGQAEPGIITRAGVLINGNTRRAALRELGVEHMRVGVLPPDADHDDIESIELSLQLRRSFKRDYSFMNALISLDERVAAGRPTADILREFRIRQKTFDQNRWILEFVREAIKRSRVQIDGTEVAMRLVDFESDQGKLEELYRAYTSLKAQSPDDAEALREQRLVALVLDKAKTDLRMIDSNFSESYAPNLVGDTPPVAADPVKIPGTSITVSGPSPKVAALRTLANDVLQAKAIARAPASVSAASVRAAAERLTKIDEILDKGLTKAGKDGRITKKRFAPVDRLNDANEDLALAVAAVAEAQATSTFDPSDLEDAIGDLRKQLTQLARHVARTASNSENVRWLGAAATLKLDEF
jgi:ParB-like chromosome segregation protein Spo0J